MRIGVRGDYRHWLVIVCALALSACVATIANYSAEAYKNATELKAETAGLVAKSNEPYSKHKAEVEALNVKVDAAYEYAAGLPNNDLSKQHWSLLRDESGLYGGFMKYWRDHNVVPDYLRQQSGQQIAAAFDEIICLETIKQAPTKCTAK